ESVRSPGRFEVLHREPTIVFDAAHNPDGARACAATIADEFTLFGTIIIVAGFLDGRDPTDMLEALGAPDAGLLIACTPDSPRAIPSPTVAAAATELGMAAESVTSVHDALARARAVAGPDDL